MKLILDFYMKILNVETILYKHSSESCNTFFHYSIIELILDAFEHFSLEMVPHLIWEHKHVQSLSLSYKSSLN